MIAKFNCKWHFYYFKKKTIVRVNQVNRFDLIDLIDPTRPDLKKVSDRVNRLTRPDPTHLELTIESVFLESKATVFPKVEGAVFFENEAGIVESTKVEAIIVATVVVASCIF